MLHKNATTTISAPTNAGTYYIKLNSKGLSDLQSQNPNYTITQGTNLYTFIITKAAGTAVFGGSSTKIYDGSAIANYKPTLTITAPNTASSVDLTAGTDYVWYLLDANGDKTGSALTSAPVDAGNYSVELTDAGKGKITALNSANIDWTGANAITGIGSYIINKATATVNFTNGSGQTVDYTGQTGQFDAGQFVPSISTNNGQILSVPNGVTLSVADGDFEFTPDGSGLRSTTEPIKPGTYKVTLTKKGFEKLQSATNNYDWINHASANYIIADNPSNPDTPETPTKPGDNPGKPNQPAKPGDKPDTPTKPGDQPDKPNKPGKKPGQPTKPGQPGTGQPGQTTEHPLGHKLPAGSYWKNGTLYNSYGQALYKHGHLTRLGKDELPQTGAHGDLKAEVLGLLATGLGFFGLAGKRKRKDE